MNLTERVNIVLTDSGKEIFRTPNFGNRRHRRRRPRPLLSTSSGRWRVEPRTLAQHQERAAT